MEHYTVTGMSCAACQIRVEKAVSAIPGVTRCAVSLLTNSLAVEGDVSPEDVISAVKTAGYGVSRKKTGKGDAGESAALDTETTALKKRLISSLVFLTFLMYISMGHTMFSLPLPKILSDNPLAIGIIQLLLSGIIMIINQKFFISGFRSLIHGAPNMDTLVSMGSAASFGWSVYVLFDMTGAVLRGDEAGAMADLHGFYFESAAMILTLITVGKLLESVSKGKTADALKSLMQLRPKVAKVERDGVETEIAADKVSVGEVFLVYPGESIPVDGVVLSGSSAVNEAALTGESIPVDKREGNTVSAATINTSGFLRCRATRVGGDTTLSQIIRLVEDAAATKAPIAKIADRVSGVFVPLVLLIAAVTIVIWLLLGETAGFALERGISVLVISCPCALGLATPVAIMVGNGVGAKNGILYKSAAASEAAAGIRIVALDKTGTITSGKPVVTDIFMAEDVPEKELLRTAYVLEKRSEHPLGEAVVRYIEQGSFLSGEAPPAVSDFQVSAGCGLSGMLDQKAVYGGKQSYIEKIQPLPKTALDAAERFAVSGKTPLFFAEEGRYLGMLAVADSIREDSGCAVKQLQEMGIRTVMVTGDHERTARAIGDQAGIDEVIAGVLPDEKEAAIRKLRKNGRVAMIGDGINDAPALMGADVGIAIGAGTDVAIDAADIVLMKNSLVDAAAAIRLSRAMLRNIRENLFWAFFYNILLIPLAAGAYTAVLGWTLNPMIGAAAMSLSSFCVVMNALRLNFCRIYDPSRDKKTVSKRMFGKKPDQAGSEVQQKEQEEKKDDKNPED